MQQMIGPIIHQEARPTIVKGLTGSHKKGRIDAFLNRTFPVKITDNPPEI